MIKELEAEEIKDCAEEENGLHTPLRAPNRDRARRAAQTVQETVARQQRNAEAHRQRVIAQSGEEREMALHRDANWHRQRLSAETDEQ